MVATLSVGTEDPEFEPFVTKFHDGVFVSSVVDVPQFFAAVVRTCCELFGSVLVTVWAHNHYGKCLTYQASYPDSESYLDHLTFRTKEFLTGLAVEQNDICDEAWESSGTLSRGIANPRLTTRLKIKRVISIPICSTSDYRVIYFVINLSFRQDQDFQLNDYRRRISWMRRSLALNLEMLIYRINDQIRGIVGKHIPKASGNATLFNCVANDIMAMTDSVHTTLYRWNALTERLEAESSRDRDATPHGSSNTEPPQVEQWIIQNCCRSRRPYMVESAPDKPLDDSLHHLNDMAVPVVLPDEQVIGVLRCQRDYDPKTGRSFSTHDLHFLEQFATAIAPVMERYRLLSGTSRFQQIMAEVSATLAAGEGDLNAILQRAIEVFTRVFAARLGSIFLLDKNKAGKDILVMRAGTAVVKHGIGMHRYAIGEGLTGTIAVNGGQTLVFRTQQERRSHNAYAKKYTEAPEEGQHPRNAFLGMPIRIQNKLLGIWKAEDLQPTSTHPESYFTEEDLQLAQILTNFLAYIIDTHQSKVGNWRKAWLLAQYSLEIAAAREKAEAITHLMTALKAAGWNYAMLSLYDEKTRRIRGHTAVGATWKRIIDRVDRDIDGGDILAVILRNNRSEFIRDSAKDSRCDQDAIRIAGRKAQYVIPLRFQDSETDQLIGTLQIDMGHRYELPSEERVVLDAFAQQFAITLSRIDHLQALKDNLNLTIEVIENERSMVAEAVSGRAIHSLRHRLRDILEETEQLLKEAPGEGSICGTRALTTIQDRLSLLSEDVTSILQVASSDRPIIPADPVTLHDEIAEWVKQWSSYIWRHGCTLKEELKASECGCRIAQYAFREVLSVFLINSIQAGAKQIKLTTSDSRRVERPDASGSMSYAFCLDFADDGSGLPSRVYERIFDLGYSTKDSQSGSGLGLFISRRLARQVGGDIWCAGPGIAGRGVTLRLVLPLA